MANLPSDILPHINIFPKWPPFHKSSYALQAGLNLSPWKELGRKKRRKIGRPRFLPTKKVGSKNKKSKMKLLMNIRAILEILIAHSSNIWEKTLNKISTMHFIRLINKHPSFENIARWGEIRRVRIRTEMIKRGTSHSLIPRNVTYCTSHTAWITMSSRRIFHFCRRAAYTAHTPATHHQISFIRRLIIG